MATYPAELRYTREHEWAKIEGKRARVGITTTPRTSWATWFSSSCRRWAPASPR